MITLNDIRQVVREEIISEVKERLIKCLGGFKRKPEDRMKIIQHAFPDYYIIGTWRAIEFLQRANDNVFTVLSLIKDYQEEYNEEVYIDLTNPEDVTTALVIMIAEEILFGIENYEDLEIDELVEAIKQA